MVGQLDVLAGLRVMSECPWKTGSERKRFYRPDWSGSPDCGGCEPGCGEGKSEGEARAHQCHVFGVVGMCLWPGPITMANHQAAYWHPARDAGLAESWLPS